MMARLSSSKHSRFLVRLLQSQTLTTSSSLLLLLLRRLSDVPSQDPPPPPPQYTKSVVTRAVEFLLQTPENDWSSSQLSQLLFASSPISPGNFFQITRRLPSSSTALRFLHYFQHNAPSPDTLSLSSIFQAIFELANREPDSYDKLWELYKTSKETNIPLTINAATLLIRCFGTAQMVDKSLIVFKELDPSLKNTHICNVLIGVLLRSERLNDARKLLDEMLQSDTNLPPNDFTGDIVFPALLKRKQVERSIDMEEVLGLVSKFGERSVFPNSIWLTELINRLCRDGKTNRAWEVLHELLRLGASVETAPCNALLTGLGRDGDTKRMNDLLVTMKEMDIQPTAVTFGILINHLCKSRRVDQALEVFEKMIGGRESDGHFVEPDVITYNTLIDGLCKVGRPEEGLGLMQRMRLQKNTAPNTVTYNCLMDGFCRAGEIDKAHELFNQMNKEGIKPNVITLNTLVGGMCRHCRINKAVDFFNEMQRKGLKANAIAYTTLINAFCSVNNIEKALELFNQMSNSGCSADAIVYYALISGLCQAGRLDDASFVVSKLKEAGFCPDIVCYNHLISGFCKRKKLEKAYEMLREMEEAGMKPDTVTYNTLISYFSKTGNFTIAHNIMRKMIEDGLAPTVVTYGALIHAYCLNDNVEEAMKIFRDVSSTSKVPPNTVIYNILIESLHKNDDVELALSLMDDMKANGVRPNTTTFNAIFKGLQEKNWLEKAFEMMDRMIEHACDPDYITMEILTQWLSAVGETEKLKKFVQGYPVAASTG